MNALDREGLSKVPEVTLAFWIIKIAATTLGETAGDAVSMSLNLGYAVSSIIFIGIFIAALLGRDPVLANAGNGARRLDGRHQWPWL